MGGQYPGRVLPPCWMIHMCRRFEPLFWPSEDWTQSFWGTLLIHQYQNDLFWVPILPVLDLFGPKFHFCHDLYWNTLTDFKFSKIASDKPIFRENKLRLIFFMRSFFVRCGRVVNKLRLKQNADALQYEMEPNSLGKNNTTVFMACFIA